MNWNFEESLDILIQLYIEKREEKNKMHTHVQSLSTKLNQYNREGAEEREHLNEFEKTVDELKILQSQHSMLTTKMDDMTFKLGLSEKGNGLLASRLSIKSDQLKDFMRRAAGGSGGSGGSGGGGGGGKCQFILYFTR